MNHIHKLSDVQSTSIGDETYIWQWVVVFSKAKIGRECNINAHCLVENDVVVGDRVTLKCGVYLWDGTTIENDVFVGPNVTFTNDLYPRSKQHLKKYPKTILKKGSSIGANATILAGITIGEYSLVGAGAVLTKDVPPYSIWYGNPASDHGKICICAQKLSIPIDNKNIQCDKCGRKYSYSNNNLVLR